MTLFYFPEHSRASRNPLDVVLNRLPSKPLRSAGGFTAKCPAHNDRNPSLSIREASDGKVLLKCFAGCSTESVLSALGLQWGDLFTNDIRGRGVR